MLSIRNLRTRTGHIFSAEVKGGIFIALMGINGAGKSTLLSTLAGLLPPSDGKTFIDEHDILKMAAIDRARKIAMLSTERSETMSLSVSEAVSLGRIPHTGWSGKLEHADIEAVENALFEFSLVDFEERNASQLSDGERQRVALARVIAQAADIVLLDEPLSHLDIPWQRRVIRTFRSLADSGKIVIASLHEFEHATSASDEIWLMEQKKILRGTPEELRRTGIFTQVFGI